MQVSLSPCPDLQLPVLTLDLGVHGQVGHGETELELIPGLCGAALLRLIPHLAEDEEVLVEQNMPLLGPLVVKQNLRLRFILCDDIKGFLMNQKLNYCFKGNP